MKNKKLLIVFILVPILLGALVGLITVPNTDINSILPKWIFPLVWTILYALMGISSYMIYQEEGEIPKIYIVQLIVNYLWVFIFFKFKLFMLAFIWILFLILLVIVMIKRFTYTKKLAGYLQIPYLIWLLIAAVLSFMQI